MKAKVRRIYFSEAVTQCEYAIHAAENVNFALQRASAPLPDQDRDEWRNSQRGLLQEVFRAIHSFLTHTSNVSRLFWPTNVRRRNNETDESFAKRSRPVVRADALRTAAGLSRDNLLRDRTLRDHLEHFDERLDDWAENTRHVNFIQDIIGPPNTIQITPAPDPGDVMRWFDPATAIMSFRGGKYALQPMLEALQDVRIKCTEAQRSAETEAHSDTMREIKERAAAREVPQEAGGAKENS